LCNLKLKETTNKMKKILDNYFKANNWIVFAIIMILYFIALSLELRYIFTDDFYHKAFTGKLNLDSMQHLITKERGNEWLNYPIAFIVVLFPTIMIAFALNIGSVLYDYKIKYVELFKITLKAEIIFAVNYLIATILKLQEIIERDYSNINNNYDFQSLAYLFRNKGLPFWIMYPLQNINITEIAHILILSYGFAWLSQKKFIKSIGFVVLFYGVALLVWVVFTVFLQTILYN
jgi:hypothetical protein